MMESMRQLFREMTTPGFASEILIDSVGRLLMVEIARHFRSLSSTRDAHGKRLAQRHLDRIYEYVDGTYGRGVTVEELAYACSLSSDYLRHAFKDSTGE